MINKLPPTIRSSRVECVSLINAISSRRARRIGTRVFRGKLLDDDEGVDASLLESDAIGKNLAMPSLSWSGLMDFRFAVCFESVDGLRGDLIVGLEKVY
jgi:hypothetical protein